MRVLRTLLVPFLTLVVASCVIIKNRDIREVAPAPQVVESPLRVFLADGSVVLFPDGATLSGEVVRGAGQRYDLMRTHQGSERELLLDSVVGIEAYDSNTDPGLTFLASLGTTAVTVAGGVALICAADPKCFGSCPTVYTYDDAGEWLQAEAFSFSISPLLEARDVDRLAVRPDADGRVELEIRNEALETHFINHAELLEVRHAPEERALTDHANQPLVVGALHPIGRVADREGRELTALVAVRDGETPTASATRLAAMDALGVRESARESAPESLDRDWLEMTLPAAEADSVALVLKLRNSLLSTVLFYEFMLGRQGAAALDWMAREVEQIRYAVELGDWFHRTMGLRLEVQRDGHFEQIARLGDTGPIAWKEVAFVVPVTPDRPTRLRLTSLVDEWRIDHIAWSPHVARPEVLTHAPVSVTSLHGGGTPDDLTTILAPDEDYLVTSAGTAFTLRFETGAAPAEGSRTFLLSSQGYYTEWVRPMWVRSAETPERFRPDASLLPELLTRWQELRTPMEDAFHDTRIPVR